MQKVLIVSDKTSMTAALEAGFDQRGWTSDCIEVPELMKGNDSVYQDCRCLVHFIDREFPKRFEGALEEMAALFKQCPVTSLYLVFEGDYLPTFASWLEHTRRLFRLAMHAPNLQKAIQEIVWLESAGVSAAYSSPMDSA